MPANSDEPGRATESHPSSAPPRTPSPRPLTRAERRSFLSPDETRIFEKGRVDVVHIAGQVVSRLTLEPGWRWSIHVKPIAGTAWDWAMHMQYQQSGRLHVVLVDGTEFETGPGTVCALPGGSDTWVVGNETVTLVDWAGALSFAKRMAP
jgi:hypothetical protein